MVRVWRLTECGFGGLFTIIPCAEGRIGERLKLQRIPLAATPVFHFENTSIRNFFAGTILITTLPCKTVKARLIPWVVLHAMAPKKSPSGAMPTPSKPVPSHSRAVSSPTPSTASSKLSSPLSNKSSPQEVALHVWNQYLEHTPSRTLLLDTFMAFLVLVGGIQFLYAVVGGNYVRLNKRQSPLRHHAQEV